MTAQLPNAQHDMEPALKAQSQAGKRRHWVLWVALGVVALLLGLGAVATGSGRVVGYMARHRAAELGFTLHYDELELVGREQVRLRGVTLVPKGIEGATVHVDVVEVGLRGTEIASISLDRATVALTGEEAARALAVASWTQQYSRVFRLPVSGHDIGASFRGRDGEPPWLVTTGCTLSSERDLGRASCASSSAWGMVLGAVVVGWKFETAQRIVLDVSRRERLATATVSLGQGTLRVEGTLLPTKVSGLVPGVGAANGVVATGSVDVSWAGEGSSRAMDGGIELRLRNWVPPHPSELNGVVFGKETTATMKLRSAAGAPKTELRDVAVRAGKLELKGGGVLQRVSDHAILHLDLTGPVACSELAGPVARSELGDLLGGLAEGVARRAVDGSVLISVAIDGDSRNLGAVKTTPKVGVGCRLGLPSL